MIVHLHLAVTLRMHGAIPPFPIHLHGVVLNSTPTTLPLPSNIKHGILCLSSDRYNYHATEQWTYFMCLEILNGLK
jgi:hypothetical protein